MTDEEVDSVAATLRLMTSPTRLRIILAIAKIQSATNLELQQLLGFSQPLLYIHLKALEGGGVLRKEGNGWKTRFSLASPLYLEAIVRLMKR